MTKDPNDLLLGSGNPTAKFPTIGSHVVGTVVTARTTQQTDINGKPKFFDNGDPMEQVICTLQTDERDPQVTDDRGLRDLYIKGQMLRAVGDALRKANAKLAPGGRLAVRYVSDEAAQKAGHNPKKIYAAAYEAGPAAGVDNLLAGDGQAQEPVAVGADASDLL